MWLSWVSIGSIFAAIGVGAGAFGAHYLKTRLSIDELQTFEVAVRYQLYHALALLAVAFVGSRLDSWTVRAAGWAFVSGIILFSGSLYAYVFTGQRSFGAITPIGGVAFLLGWLFLASSSLTA